MISLNRNIRLFDPTSIREIHWPSTEDGDYARRYIASLLEQRVDRLIPNVNTSLHVLQVGDAVLPVTVNDKEYGNSYVCSPYTHYVSYAREELYVLNSRFARIALGGLLHALGFLMRFSRINRTVHINNWLLSTNLYGPLPDSGLEQAVRLLLREYPGHSLVFRSLNRTTNGPLIDLLAGLGFRMVPSRQVYLLHPSDPAATNSKARWLVKRDYGLLAKHGYETVGPDRLTEADMPRLAELYRLLYLDKYSTYNPQFGAPFLELAWRQKLLELHAIRHIDTGRIDAVLGFYCRSGVMTTPVFGYDTALPQERGLYRMLSAVLIGIAGQRGLLLHESSGAPQFKRNRGAVADIEYSAVYDRHLPARQRISWALLDKLLNGFGTELLQKYKL